MANAKPASNPAPKRQAKGRPKVVEVTKGMKLINN